MAIEKISDEELKETITRDRKYFKSDLLQQKEMFEKELLEINNKLKLFTEPKSI